MMEEPTITLLTTPKGVLLPPPPEVTEPRARILYYAHGGRELGVKPWVEWRHTWEGRRRDLTIMAGMLDLVTTQVDCVEFAGHGLQSLVKGMEDMMYHILMGGMQSWEWHCHNSLCTAVNYIRSEEVSWQCRKAAGRRFPGEA